MTTPLKLTIVGALLVGGLLASSGLAMYYKQKVNQLIALTVPAESPARVAKPRPALPPPPPAYKPIMTHGPGEGEDPALLARIAELEAALQARDQQLLAYQNVPAPATEPPERPRRNPSDWMEDLKTNDPERYQEIIARRDAMRQRVNDSFAKKAAHFLNRDTARMTEDEAGEYSHMLQLLTDTWQLSEQMRSDQIPGEDRGALRRELGEKMQELRPILDNQRDREFYDLGLQLGYTQDSAHEFVGYINEMIDITSMSSMFRGGGGPRGGGGGGGGRLGTQ